MEDEQYYKLLIQRFTDRTASDEELEVFVKLVNEGKLDQYLIESMNQDFGITMENEAAFQAVDKIKPMWPRITAAACIVVALTIGGYFYINSNHGQQLNPGQLAKNDIRPGTNTATLTLANGQKIKLTNSINGQIARQAGVNISKTQNGQLVYAASDKSIAAGNQLNTLATIKGETFSVNLPDGTRVWLNAASSLTYPANFNGGSRKVTLYGEGYFEVAKDKAHPFEVTTQNQQVVVLGTHFDINAYDNENATKTTLLEGSIKVSTPKSSKVIKPGEQAILKGAQINVSTVDKEQAIAWKNNNFDFDGQDIKYIMRMVERWYNVEVSYSDDVSNEKFYGGAPRYKNLSEVLKALESTKKVRFQVAGRKIIVTN